MNFDFSPDFVTGTVIFFVIDMILRIGFLLYVPRNRKPSAAMAWLLAIFLIPGLGVLVFLAIGSTKLSRERRGRQRTVDYIIESLTKPDTDVLSLVSDIQRERYRPIIELNQSLGKLPVRAGNEFTFLADYDKSIADLITHIDKATKYIYLEYYIIALDDTTRPIFLALESAVGRGVEVYVLFDPIGSLRYRGYKKMQKELTRIGVRWHKALPLGLSVRQYNRPDLRNHRKIVVIDDAYAYIGSQNLIERTYQRKDHIRYDEFVVRMSGPIVNQCAVIFAGDWYSETTERLNHIEGIEEPALQTNNGGSLAQILPSGPGYTHENNLKLFLALLYTARKRVVITNPYFVPDESLLLAVISAVKRGVEITIINSKVKDLWLVGHAQRSYYRQLLELGVHIYLHDAPVLLHSKHLTIDDDIAVIGSSNMDIRSFELNMECVVVVYDKAVVKNLKKQQDKDLTNSTKVDLEDWKKRPVRKELMDAIARLTAALQ